MIHSTSRLLIKVHWVYLVTKCMMDRTTEKEVEYNSNINYTICHLEFCQI